MCEGAGVPYLPADAGLYIWLDLRCWLGEGEKREKDLCRRLISDHGLMMTPGESMDMRAPGFFRLVFTAVGDEEVSAASGGGASFHVSLMLCCFLPVLLSSSRLLLAHAVRTRFGKARDTTCGKSLKNSREWRLMSPESAWMKSK